MTKKELFLIRVSDIVSNLCYYDRKNDEELSVKDVEELLNNNQVTLFEIVEILDKEIKANFPLWSAHDLSVRDTL